MKLLSADLHGESEHDDLYPRDTGNVGNGLDFEYVKFAVVRVPSEHCSISISAT